MKTLPLQTNQPMLMRFNEARAYLRISRSTLYRLMRTGKLRGYKVGSTWRFYQKDLKACLTPGEVCMEEDE